MDYVSLLHVARQKHSINAAKRRAAQVFTLSWRGGGASQITGWQALSETLHLKQTTLAVLFSRNGGQSFTTERPSPLTGELDVLTVTKLVNAKPKAKRGRPRTRPLTEAEVMPE